MSKFRNFKKYFAIGSQVAKPFVPGGVGTILDVVNEGLSDKDDPANEKAILALAHDSDEQAEVIAEIITRVKALEAYCRKCSHTQYLHNDGVSECVIIVCECNKFETL